MTALTTTVDRRTVLAVDLATLVAKANDAGRSSSRAGAAPTLAVDSDRATLIAWLKWNDRNGDFDPKLVAKNQTHC